MSEQRDYRDTVFLPKTDFPMKAGLPQKEPGILARWEDEGLYQRLREARVELAQARNFDFIIVNQDFTHALRDLKQVVAAQRLRYAAQRLSHPEVFRALGIL